MRLIFFTILFHFTFVAYNIYGCTLAPTPLTDFDSSEYIFIGEVIEYTETLEFNRNSKVINELPYYRKLQFTQSNGLIVKVKNSIYLPKIPKTFFEVFPFALDSSCGTLGIQKYALEKEYPINSEVLIVAKESTYFPSILPNGNFRVEIKQGRNSLITNNVNKKNETLSSVNSIFDYKQTVSKNAINYDAFYASKFELRKDLLRLKNAKTEQDKLETLNRLSYFYKSYWLLDFYSLLNKYAKDSKESVEIYKNYLKFSEFPEETINKEIENWQKSRKSKRARKKTVSA